MESTDVIVQRFSKFAARRAADRLTLLTKVRQAKQEVLRKRALVVIFLISNYFWFCFVVAILDLVHDVKTQNRSKFGQNGIVMG